MTLREKLQFGKNAEIGIGGPTVGADCDATTPLEHPTPRVFWVTERGMCPWTINEGHLWSGGDKLQLPVVEIVSMDDQRRGTFG